VKLNIRNQLTIAFGVMLIPTMAAGSSEVNESIENIASVGEQNSAAVEQVSAASKEMSLQVEEVSASAQSLAEMACNLKEVVAQFRLN
jgi:methyl-accepting chemotaxis protein